MGKMHDARARAGSRLVTAWLRANLTGRITITGCPVPMATGIAIGSVVAVQLDLEGQVVALCAAVVALGSQEVGLEAMAVVLLPNSWRFAVSLAWIFPMAAPRDAVLVSDRGSVDPQKTNQGPS